MYSLEETRELWEEGLEVKVVIGETKDKVHVILKDDENYYSLHTYTKIRDEWKVSISMRKMPLDDIWSKLYA